ncbi:MAG TPA: hypothetical protein VHC63_08365 [Acidimicrobiales bacterium]|nr:hypothetical protein [Acidimicrobiales bacterium]
MVIAQTAAHASFAFGATMVGIAVVLVGLGNMAGRRVAKAVWGPLGSERAIWFRAGLFFLPYWLALAITALGVTIIVIGAASASLA